uniref:Uncharacterized protein n=1 Tax=Peronospora matthiolae TaxID=2874970 RepID=A0AAV1TCK3_9STRA
MRELFSFVALNEEDALVEVCVAFFGEEGESFNDQAVDRHTRDVSSWSGAVAEELSSLLDIKAPAVFSSDVLDDSGRKAIQKFANALANDVKSLKDSVSSDTLKRQDELRAMQEMIDREEQIALLLDVIEEQQGAHAEYVTTVSGLEWSIHHCH